MPDCLLFGDWPPLNWSREEYVFLAKLSEETEQYEDMVKAILPLQHLPGNWTVEERNLLSVAFKNVVGSRRSMYRILTANLRSENGLKAHEVVVAQQFLEKICREINEICETVVELVHEHCLQCETRLDDESRVFFMKMKGDYYRYQAEIAQGERMKQVIELAHQSYECAAQLAQLKLRASHPIRLGLFLNYSVFCYELLQEGRRGSEMAKDAFDLSILELNDLTEEEYKDCTVIMQLLRDGLTLWTSEVEVDPEEEED